ncbi:MAG TPA: aminopeptidase [Polyangiaceae bacterium]|nr:aminopeptidase [Polyangiaceae bacterium]
MRLILSLAILAGLVSSLAGCSTLGYVAQAAAGQWELAGSARPIPEVIEDPKTPALTKSLLSDIESVRRFAWQNGLNVAGNYEKYVELDREYPIWFVNASHPLAFRARIFSFPIVGSFPGLAWFDKANAEKFRDSLGAKGYDVNMRGVSAFSTGGWFDDPIVWSMLDDAPGALASLVNTVLHESLHATILVKDEQYYNESLAAFVGDTMAAHYLQQRSGERMPAELRAYLLSRRLGQQRAKRLNEVYQELDTVYQSRISDAEKYEKKKQIIDRLMAEMRLVNRPNNATLIGFKLYQVGKDDFSELFAACGYSWRRFLTAAGSLKTEDFGELQRAEFGPVVAALRARGCPTEVRPLVPFSIPERRWRSKQRVRQESINAAGRFIRRSESTNEGRECRPDTPC